MTRALPRAAGHPNYGDTNPAARRAELSPEAQHGTGLGGAQPVPSVSAMSSPVLAIRNGSMGENAELHLLCCMYKDRRAATCVQTRALLLRWVCTAHPCRAVRQARAWCRRTRLRCRAARRARPPPASRPATATTSATTSPRPPAPALAVRAPAHAVAAAALQTPTQCELRGRPQRVAPRTAWSAWSTGVRRQCADTPARDCSGRAAWSGVA